MLFRKLVLFTGLLFFLACSSATESDDNAPQDHTINKDGIMHKSGLDNPGVNCVSCHGSNLRGGDEAPSCYKCHGQKW
jgi:hypothetical protein